MERLILKNVEKLDENVIDSDRLINLTPDGTVKTCFIQSDLRVETRGGGDFHGVAFYLDDMHDWKLGKDDEGATILVPLSPKR